MSGPPAWPRVMVVTDRRRLARRVGAAVSAWPSLLAGQVRAALDAGADLVQVREADLPPRELAAWLRELFERVPGSAGRLVVNDRVDVAVVTGAAGVHLPEAGLAIPDVRRLRSADKRFVVGRSVHDAASAAAASGASYLVAGTVRPSASKPSDRPLLGWDGLAAVAGAARPVPVVAIGGLGPADAAAVLRSGAVGLAGIEWFLPAPGQAIERSVRERVEAVRAAFDSVGGVADTQSASA